MEIISIDAFVCFWFIRLLLCFSRSEKAKVISEKIHHLPNLPTRANEEEKKPREWKSEVNNGSSSCVATSGNESEATTISHINFAPRVWSFLPRRVSILAPRKRHANHSLIDFNAQPSFKLDYSVGFRFSFSLCLLLRPWSIHLVRSISFASTYNAANILYQLAVFLHSHCFQP